jgi:hypothetical protein
MKKCLIWHIITKWVIIGGLKYIFFLKTKK